jgi:hypothetical protein
MSGCARVKLYGPELRDGTRPCMASALLPGDAPPPQWALTQDQRNHLVDLWRASPLVPSSPDPRQLPQGQAADYRGAAILCPSGDGWFAYRSVVMCKNPGFAPEYRTDIDRRFERALLQTAPAGLLPGDLL